jgi:hypothetical protein
VQIADGIGRGLSYAQIAAELRKADGGRVSVNTVRNTVRAMALMFDEPKELAPRWRIYMWVKQGEWAAEHTAAD